MPTVTDDVPAVPSMPSVDDTDEGEREEEDSDAERSTWGSCEIICKTAESMESTKEGARGEGVCSSSAVLLVVT